MTFALVLLMLFRARSKQMKQLGKLSFGASLFNISEPIVFGTPIVMNPTLLIPFILAPLVSVIITYLAMDFGWVARPNGVLVPWTTPVLISGYLATGGKISGMVLQAVNIIVAMCIYYPFFRVWDKKKAQEEMQSIDLDATVPNEKTVDI